MTKEQIIANIASGKITPGEGLKQLEELSEAKPATFTTGSPGELRPKQLNETFESFHQWIRRASLANCGPNNCPLCDTCEDTHRQLFSHLKKVAGDQVVTEKIERMFFAIFMIGKRESDLPFSGTPEEYRRFFYNVLSEPKSRRESWLCGGFPDDLSEFEPAFDLLYRRYQAERSKVNSMARTEDTAPTMSPAQVQHVPSAPAKQLVSVPTKDVPSSSNPTNWIIGIVVVIALIYGVAWLATQGAREQDYRERQRAKQRIYDNYMARPAEERFQRELEYEEYKRDPKRYFGD